MIGADAGGDKYHHSDRTLKVTRSMSFMNELTCLLGGLVSIDSVNPDLVPGANGEGEIASFVAAWLEKRGLEAHLE
ncbi:MAG: hypothetical protein WBZ29_03895, partial [Methanocella sp.]